ncbi:PucR family transcriptional regulator [Flexivirga endophytica]|uniref:PucR family transcriptional regulator n=1 Tax=Flexivirga endophytica TaxID=1849103 RepID=A0A916X0S4_9MICO|nr:helix-turn-helix domain-containing protein [Flexivirga endophytica]GGB44931.1 PucR family transcriptional regulator [Flexivirga endophytica]GHB68820.1 PucR family transcriptional regulator [Flexivirga endophytica]
MVGHTTLGTVVEWLGLTLLTARAGSVDSARPVQSVVVYDVADPPAVPAGAVVLGVGVHGEELIAELLEDLSRRKAAALIVREPVPVSPMIENTASYGGVALLGLVRGASWMQVARMLDDRHAHGDGSAGAAADALDLFEVANSLSALLNTPVTIEDVSSHIVAFSADQAHADEARKASVLGHQVPARYNDPMVEGGVFRRLYAASEPIFVPSIADGIRPRAAMPVRAGSEVMGSIWAIVDEPLSRAHATAMVEAARTAAIAMLRQRVATDASRQMRTALVSGLIDGGPEAVSAAARMRGTISGGCVLAAGIRVERTSHDAAVSAQLDRLANALRMWLHPELPDSAVAVVDETVYAVVPTYADQCLKMRQLRRLAGGFVKRAAQHDEFVMAIGKPVAGVAALGESRREADLALRVLRTTDTLSQRVAVAADLQSHILLMQLADLMANENTTLSGPIAILRAYDEQHQAALADTLHAWLDNFGDVAAAAAALHVHKNTFRYRLGRLVQIADIDLDDPEVRFQLMMQFRLAAQLFVQ